MGIEKYMHDWETWLYLPHIIAEKKCDKLLEMSLSYKMEQALSYYCNSKTIKAENLNKWNFKKKKTVQSAMEINKTC